MSNYFKLECPHCNQSLEASTDMSGEQVKCPSCNQTTIIPGAPDDAITAQASSASTSESPPMDSDHKFESSGESEPTTTSITQAVNSDSKKDPPPAPTINKKKIYMFVLELICGGALTCVVAEVSKPSENIVFPGAEWERRAPVELGLNTNVLAGIDELMEKAEANGVLIHNGYLVAEWTYSAASDTRINAKSQTKCILGIVYGLALDDGLIPSPDTKVKELWPEFNAGPYAAEITFEHLATATSGLKATGPFWQHFTKKGRNKEFRPPGMPGEYHNDHAIYLAGALTYIYGQDLLEVLRERVLYKIGSDADWITNGEGAPERLGNHGTFRSADSNDPVVPPGYVALNDGRQFRWVSGFARSWWTAGDLARVGWLFLNNGNWNGAQLISEAYVRECFQYVPDRPYLAWRTVSVPENDDWWFMSGAGGQFCVLIPEHNMVMVKLNNWRNKSNGGDGKRPQVGLREFVPLLSGVKLAP